MPQVFSVYVLIIIWSCCSGFEAPGDEVELDAPTRGEGGPSDIVYHGLWPRVVKQPGKWAPIL